MILNIDEFEVFLLRRILKKQVFESEKWKKKINKNCSSDIKTLALKVENTEIETLNKILEKLNK